MLQLVFFHIIHVNLWYILILSWKQRGFNYLVCVGMEKSVPLNAAPDSLLHVNFCYILILYIFEYQSCVLSFGSQHMRYRM